MSCQRSREQRAFLRPTVYTSLDAIAEIAKPSYERCQFAKGAKINEEELLPRGAMSILAIEVVCKLAQAPDLAWPRGLVSRRVDVSDVSSTYSQIELTYNF